MFERVLVANRGEIAVRVIRTLRRLGIEAVAVYSDADAGARHVRAADRAVRLGPAAARASYLSVERILDAATSTGAQAVHPGYGFLSENPALARACLGAGLVFVGPSAEAIEVMGDKIRAKEAVGAAGVPVVPGVGAPGMTDAQLVAAAGDLGPPLLVKPSAGGGGKGMRVVTDLADLPAALVSARREASASFGDDTLLLERYVARPRHIEVQVLADRHGATLHLGERECSLQRRHQKVIEEAPSPFLTPAQREAYGALAVATARSVGYEGAGTVELIVDAQAPDSPYFMEMNTRLQVEHPVTEMVTGLDLVELQLRVAAGKPLGMRQSDVVLTGHAIEARVYAEDPAAGFLPTGGPALVLREPAGDGVRVDSALAAGQPVGTTYDPMISKVVAWGPDRSQALARLDRALAGHVLLGCTTNVGFLRGLLALPEVRAGDLDTGLLERTLDRTVPPGPGPVVYAAFALHRLAGAAGSDPWDALPGWRPSVPAPVRWDLTGAGGDRLAVSYLRGVLAVGEATYAVSGTVSGDEVLVTVDGETGVAVVARSGADTWVAAGGAVHRLSEAPPLRTKGGGVTGESEVHSPMPGAVVAVHVRSGDTVATGDPLLVVEAMKMEHVLRSPSSGRVDLLVRSGEQVVVGQLLARVDGEARSRDNSLANTSREGASSTAPPEGTTSTTSSGDSGPEASAAEEA